MANKTVLYDEHTKLGAKIVEFAGYMMPIQYGGILKEHRRVRTSVGMFDVSHMGEFIVRGADAESFLQNVTINNVFKLAIGQAQYSAMCFEDGGIVDDLLLYRLPDYYMMVVNASNLDKDWNWLQQHKPGSVQMENVSDQTTLLAVQGKKSGELLQKLTDDYADRTTVKTFYQFWHQPIFTISGNHVINEVIHLCGGQNIFFDLPTLSPQISLEAVLKANPEVIIASGADALRPEWLDNWQRWPSLSAVQAHHLYFIPPDLILRHTPRILEGAAMLCKHLDKARK